MNPYLLNVLETGPAVLRRLLAKIPEARWDERTDVTRFSLREAVAHLNDWEPILLERMQTAHDTPGAAIAVYDEGERALKYGYAALDPLEQAAEFAARRKATAEWLRSLPKAAFANSVQHPERGEMTIEDQANMLLGHDLYHLEQVSAYLPNHDTFA